MAHGSAPINRAAYTAAQAMIAAGVWRVDAEAGRIWSTRHGRWIGSIRTANGYVYVAASMDHGQFKLPAHRVIWEFANGPIPGTLEVNHKNGIKTDNRLANLELTDSSGNAQHAYDTKLRRPTVGVINGMTKLTEEQVLEIRRLCQSRVPQADIATQYGLTPSAVSNIKRGVSWRHLPGQDRARGKLTTEQLAEVAELLRAGVPQAKIGAQFGVTQSAISYLKRRCTPGC